MKKRYILIPILIIVSFFIMRYLSLPLVLARNGYNAFDYEVYRDSENGQIWGYESGEDQKVLKVYGSKEGKGFNYIIVGKKSFGLTQILSVGQYHKSDIEYASNSWMEAYLINDLYDFEVGFTEHKIFEISKDNDELEFLLDELPDYLHVDIKEEDKSYILEIYTEKSNTISVDIHPMELSIQDLLSLKKTY